MSTARLVNGRSSGLSDLCGRSLLTSIFRHYIIVCMLKAFSSIGPILKGLAQSFGWEKGIAAAMLETRWAEVVGEAIASHTHPEEIRFDTLHIVVDSAVWMHELSFLKKALIEKINRVLGKNGIRNVHFKIGPLTAKPASPVNAPSLSRELGEEEIVLLNQLLSPVSDEDLKKAIQKALRKHLQKIEIEG
jgi:hypothetical protein